MGFIPRVSLSAAAAIAAAAVDAAAEAAADTTTTTTTTRLPLVVLNQFTWKVQPTSLQQWHKDMYICAINRGRKPPSMILGLGQASKQIYHLKICNLRYYVYNIF